MATRVIDGCRCYVADVKAGGVFVLERDSFTKIGFIPTGAGTRRLHSGQYGKHFYFSGSRVNSGSWRDSRARRNWQGSSTSTSASDRPADMPQALSTRLLARKSRNWLTMHKALVTQQAQRKSDSPTPFIRR
jgi:hypothetical protein